MTTPPAPSRSIATWRPAPVIDGLGQSQTAAGVDLGAAEEIEDVAPASEAEPATA